MTREMKDSGIKWVHEIPQSWNVIKGKYLFTNKKQVVGAKVEEYGLEHPSQNPKNKQVMETKHCIKYSLGYCSKTGKKLAEPIFLVDEKGQKYKLSFDCKNCRMKVHYP